MKEYTGDKIRNVAIVGHGGAGTTSVTEALLYRSGAISRMCKVEDGATTTDYEPEEIKRKVSVNATLAPVEWRDTKINFIDTPGFADFVAEVKGAFRAVDSALIVVCATSGVQVGTEQCWKLAEEAGLPRIIFVNKMDRENADFDSILDNLRGKFGKHVLPLQLPLGKEDNFQGIIDLYKMKAYRANGNGSDEIEIPDEYKEAAAAAHEKMVEAAVEADDDCMMRYLEGEEISDEEIMKCLIKGIRQAIIYPMLCGSAYKNIGLGRLMNAIIDFTYPAILNDYIVMDKETGEEEVRDANAPMAALVFKTTSDPFVGRLSYFRVFSGSIKADSVVYNSRREEEERIANIFTMRGKTQIPMKQVPAGDIGVVAKLQYTSTGDTLCDKNSEVEFPPINFPLPMYTRAIYPKKKGDEDKIMSALNRLMDEDPTIIVTKNPVTKETLISGMGDQHIDIIMERMQRKFGVEAILKAPIIEYRETIRGSAEVEGKHKKQSGGHGQYGHVWIEFEPCMGDDLVFEERVFGGAVPRNFFPAVEKGLQECVRKGVLAGCPVVGLKAILVDGSYHPVDSSEMAFKMAASIAYKEGLPQADPVMLEPIGSLNVTAPDENTGDVMGELNKRRGRVLGMEPVAPGMTLIQAEVPIREMQDFALYLRQSTRGMGEFSFTFLRYEQLPANLLSTVIASVNQQNG